MSHTVGLILSIDVISFNVTRTELFWLQIHSIFALQRPFGNCKEENWQNVHCNSKVICFQVIKWIHENSAAQQNGLWGHIYIIFPHAIKAVKKSMDVKIHKLHSVYNCIYSKNPDLRNQARKALSFASVAKKVAKTVKLGSKKIDTLKHF